MMSLLATLMAAADLSRESAVQDGSLRNGTVFRNEAAAFLPDARFR